MKPPWAEEFYVEARGESGYNWKAYKQKLCEDITMKGGLRWKQFHVENS